MSLIILSQSLVKKTMKTEQGKKIVSVRSYTKNVKGKPVKVHGHRRSTPNK